MSQHVSTERSKASLILAKTICECILAFHILAKCMFYMSSSYCIFVCQLTVCPSDSACSSLTYPNGLLQS